MTIIERVYRDVKSGVALEDAIPEGADPKYWRRILAGYTPNKAPKKPRPYRDNGRRKSSKSRMQSVVNRATLTLVERVNQPKADSWFTINTGDFTAKVDRKTNWVSYEDNEL